VYKNRSLRDAPEAIFRIWRERERIEIEAAGVFNDLGHLLKKVNGGTDVLSELAFKSSNDELNHQQLCRNLLNKSPFPIFKIKPGHKVIIGPEFLTDNERLLYVAVAVCAIMETLSTALLMEMKNLAKSETIREIIHTVLVDEVDHSRLDWAILEKYSNHLDTGFLKPYVESMICEASNNDIKPMLADQEENMDLSPWGVLSPTDSQKIITETLNEVIYPGLKMYGILL